MNKSAIATILATAALGIAKKASGSQNQGITVHSSLYRLKKYANDPDLASQVVSVRLGSRKINQIPPEISNLTNLRELDLFGNQITHIPPEIFGLTNLKVLNLGSNQITHIPPEIGNLTNLEWLLLSRNEISEIPLEIGNLTNLKGFDLRGNPNLEITPLQIRKMIQLGYAKNPIITDELLYHLSTNSENLIRRF